MCRLDGGKNKYTFHFKYKNNDNICCTYVVVQIYTYTVYAHICIIYTYTLYDSSHIYNI